MDVGYSVPATLGLRGVLTGAMEKEMGCPVWKRGAGVSEKSKLGAVHFI